MSLQESESDDEEEETEVSHSNTASSDEDIMVQLQVGKTFNSFDEVKALLDTLKATNHPMRVFNSQSVDDYNKRRLQAKEPLEPIDKKWKYVYYVIACVHFGAPRKRSTGIRCKQRHLAIGCSAKVTISYDRKLQCLVVRQCELQHSHRISCEIMKHYTSSRKLSTPEQLELNELLVLRPNNKQLLDYIHVKYDKLVTLKDIQNMKLSLKRTKAKGRRDEQILLDSLEDALIKDANAKGGVTVTENNEIATVSFQTGRMSTLFEKFPEILLIDGTYNVNRAKMPLYCFMVEDGFGNGRNIFYSATAEESSVHLLNIIQTFKMFNPLWESVRVIVIDKDFTEMPALQQEFPQASILFCQFHVIKYLFKQIVELDVAKDSRDQAREAIRRLVNANSESEYAAFKQDLFDTTNSAFKGYFLKNWDACKQKWTTFLRDDHLHFANTTNNRLECHNHKLKDVVARSMSVSEMFDKVLLFSRTNAAEYSHKSFVEEFSELSTAHDSIAGVSEICSTCTAYSSERMIEQLKLSHTVKYTITKGENTDNFIAVYKTHQHHVSLSANCCSCSFSKVMGLPCRHIFAVRTSQNLPAFKLQLVAERWRKDYQLLVDPIDFQDTSVAAEVQVSTISSKVLSKSTLSKNQKYKKILGIGQKLAELVSGCGMAEFRRKGCILESLLKYWGRNCEVEIMPLQDVEDGISTIPVANNDQDGDGSDNEQSAIVTQCDQESSKDDDMQDVLHDVSFEDAPFLDEVVQDVPVAVPFKDVPPDAPLDGDIMQDVPVDDVNGIQNAPVDVSLKRTEQALQEPSLHSSSALQQATDGSQSDAKDTSSSVPAHLHLSVLRDNIKFKEYVKPKGRPRHTSKLWPSKNKKRSIGKENQPHNTGSIPEPKRKCLKTYLPGSAANRLRIKRELERGRKVKDVHLKAENYVTLSSDEDESSDVSHESTGVSHKVVPSDYDILKSPSGWLNDRLVNAGLALLKLKFPAVSMLEDVVRAQTGSFSEDEGVSSEFVQILNCFGDHWICVTNKRCKPHEIKVYDSMRTGDICHSAKEAIAVLAKSTKSYIFLTFPDVQQQQGGFDCGLYSLAFSYSLCAGTDPARVVYNQADFRSHFIHCLKQKEMSEFPHDVVMKNPGKSLLRKVKIFCSCRLPNTGDAMVQCSKCNEWFHWTCVGNDWQENMSAEDWYCVSCR